MMKCYYFKITLLRKGKVIICDNSNKAFTDKPLEKKEILLTWDNIDEYYKKYGFIFGWGLAQSARVK